MLQQSVLPVSRHSVCFKMKSEGYVACLIAVLFTFSHGQTERSDEKRFSRFMNNIANRTMVALSDQFSRIFGDAWTPSTQTAVNNELIKMCPDANTQRYCIPITLSNPINIGKLLQVALNNTSDRWRQAEIEEREGGSQDAGGGGQGENVFLRFMTNLSNWTMLTLNEQLSRVFGNEWSASTQSAVNEELLKMCPDTSTQMFCISITLSNPSNIGKLVQIAFNDTFDRLSSTLDWSVDPESLQQTAAYFIESFANNMGIQLDPSSMDYVYDELESLCPEGEDRPSCLKDIPTNPDETRALEEAAVGEYPKGLADRIRSVLQRTPMGDSNMFHWLTRRRESKPGFNFDLDSINETRALFFSSSSPTFPSLPPLNTTTINRELESKCTQNGNWRACLYEILTSPRNLSTVFKHPFSSNSPPTSSDDSSESSGPRDFITRFMNGRRLIRG